jgi:Protein of unknown function (DUF3717)
MQAAPKEIFQQLTLTDLEVAINKARAEAGARNADQDLKAELSELAGLYGKMIYYKQNQVPMDLLTDTELVTLLNWVTKT